MTNRSMFHEEAQILRNDIVNALRTNLSSLYFAGADGNMLDEVSLLTEVQGHLRKALEIVSDKLC